MFNAILDSIGAGPLVRWLAADPCGAFCFGVCFAGWWLAWVAFLMRLLLFYVERDET